MREEITYHKKAIMITALIMWIISIIVIYNKAGENQLLYSAISGIIMYSITVYKINISLKITENYFIYKTIFSKKKIPKKEITKIAYVKKLTTKSNTTSYVYRFFNSKGKRLFSVNERLVARNESFKKFIKTKEKEEKMDFSYIILITLFVTVMLGIFYWVTI